MYIRVAQMGDVDLLQELYGVLDEESVRCQPEHFLRALRPAELIRENLLDEASAIMIMDSEAGAVGFVHAQIQEPLDNGVYKRQRFLCVWDIVVREEFRGSGVGSALLDAITEWGRGKGAAFVRLNVLTQNESAIRFYRKHGFDCVQHTMEAAMTIND